METDLRRKAIRKVVLRKLELPAKLFLLSGLWIFCATRIQILDLWSEETGWMMRMFCNATLGFFLLACLFIIVTLTGRFLRWMIATFIDIWELYIVDMPGIIYRKIREKIASAKENFKKEVANAELEIKEEIALTQPGDLSLPENTGNEGTLALDETRGALAIAKKESA